MDELVIAREFLSRVVHLKEVDAAVTLCGMSALGLLVKKFFFPTQLGGDGGCKDCADEYVKRTSKRK
jgi:hypothetical protein